MVKNGPGLLPGVLPINLSKGHPLFYFFLASSWITIFGGSIVSIRTFSLLVSILTLVIFHFTLRRMGNKAIADFSVVLLSVQSMFLAQASLLLPEMLLALLLILSFYTFISSKFRLYALFSSFMVMTKETGVVFIAFFGVYYFFENVKQIKGKEFWLKIAWLSVPAWVYIIFLVIHYFKTGTIFFNEHLDYITLNPGQNIRNLKSAFSVLFTTYGRNSLFIALIVSSIILLFKRKDILGLRIVRVSLGIIVVLIIFSVINFYTYRYILPAFPMFILMSSVVILQAKLKAKAVNWLVAILLVSVPLYYSMTKAGKNDNDLGYTQYIPVYKQMVDYCEKQDWFDKTFSVSFNMVIALRDPFAGFLSGNKGFNALHVERIGEADIIILDSTCEEKKLPDEFKNKVRLIKRFEFKKHWGEIYERTRQPLRESAGPTTNFDSDTTN